MANTITTYEGSAFSGTLTKARDSQNSQFIKKRLLDGTYNIQTVGSAARTVDIEFLCDIEVRRDLEDSAAAGDLLVVAYGDREWTGLIDDAEIRWNPIVDTEELLTFKLLVIAEAEL